jgi:hypothetical protein
MPTNVRDFSSSPLTRRQTLKGAVGLGLAVPAARASLGSTAFAQEEGATLTIAMNGSPSDLDPHSAYDYRSAIAVRRPYETLIGLVDDKTDVYVGVIAESWEPNEDKSVWTFTIRDGVTFHDGSVCDAEAVRASFERFLTLGLGPVNVIARFIRGGNLIAVRTFDCERGGRQGAGSRRRLGSHLGANERGGARHRSLQDHPIRSRAAIDHGAARWLLEGLGRGPLRPDHHSGRAGKRDPASADRTGRGRYHRQPHARGVASARRKRARRCATRSRTTRSFPASTRTTANARSDR